MNNTGKYNRRITHCRAGEKTPDGMGGFTYADPTETVVWCKALQLSMAQKFNYGLESATVSFAFCFRYLTAKDFLFEDWFIYNGNKFIIDEITDQNDNEQEIKIICKRSE